MALNPQRPPDAQTPACPCRHGDVPAELAGQRPLLERAATGDREAFALVYDTQVEGVYRYLLAWTGNPSETAELTAQVFHAAIGWLPATTSPEGEAAAWLTAMTRDALAQHQGTTQAAGSGGSGPGSEAGGPGSGAGGAGSGAGGAGSGAGVPHPALPAFGPPEGESSRRRHAAPASVHTPWPAAGAPPEAPRDVAAAVARLREPEREVVVLRLLLGHSLDHTAHLSGYSRRAVLELQLTACLAIHELTGGTHTDAAPPEARPAPSAEEFEHRLSRGEIDLTGSDPALADALAVAGSLRRSVREHVLPPPAEFVERLRAELVAGGELGGVGELPVLAAVDSREHHFGADFSGAGSPAAELSDAQLAAAQLAGVRLSEAEFWAQLSDPDLMVAPVAGSVASGNPGSPNPASARSRAAGGAGVGGWLARRPWVATGVATAGIVVVLAVQAFGGQGGPQGCEGRPCPVSTTAAVAGGAGSSIGAPLTTVQESTTTSSTVGTDASVVSPAVPRTSAVTAPPTTRPATTAPPTTAAPRPTTTAVPSTTAPPTTAPTTTTTAPAPPP
jgi:DNA-directed RNA polymerase specialized sigma24 family protein